jgi:hypothetical protein
MRQEVIACFVDIGDHHYNKTCNHLLSHTIEYSDGSPISTKQVIISCLIPLNRDRYDNRNMGPGFGQAQKSGGVQPIGSQFSPLVKRGGLRSSNQERRIDIQ